MDPVLPKSLVARLAFAAVSIFFFFVPSLCIIPYIHLEAGFTPTDALKSTADLVSYIAALGYIAIMWPSIISDVRSNWKNRKLKQSLQGFGLLVFAPIFGWGILQGFFSGPLSYYLHKQNTSDLSTRQVAVIRADDLGGKHCRNRAIIQEKAIFWDIVVCGISSEAVERLRRGGQLSIEGTFSVYGMQVQRYIIVDGA
jgi:hypothetical protein